MRCHLGETGTETGLLLTGKEAAAYLGTRMTNNRIKKEWKY